MVIVVGGEAARRRSIGRNSVVRKKSSAFQRGSVVLSVFIVLREDWTKEMEGSITRITRQKGKVVLVASGGTLAHILKHTQIRDNIYSPYKVRIFTK